MKPQFILTDGGYVIQELGADGNYRMVARVAHREEGDAERLLRLLNAGWVASEAALPVWLAEQRRRSS